MIPDPPEAFRWFASMFHQDVLEIYTTPFDAMDAYIGQMSKAWRGEMDAYLTALLADEDNRRRLKTVWRKINSDIGIGNSKSALVFFEAIHQRVRARL